MPRRRTPDAGAGKESEFAPLAPLSYTPEHKGALSNEGVTFESDRLMAVARESGWARGNGKGGGGVRSGPDVCKEKKSSARGLQLQCRMAETQARPTEPPSGLEPET